MIKKPNAVSLWYLCVFVSSCWCLTWTRQCLFRRCNLSRLGISCHKRGITQGVTHVTLCQCFYPPSIRAPLFMSRSRPLFFCLNNWLEARPAEGGKWVWLDKKRMRKLGDILASDLALSRQRCWLNILFLASPLTHLSPGKVDLSLPSPSPSFFYIIQVHVLLSLFSLMWIKPRPSKTTN